MYGLSVLLAFTLYIALCYWLVRFTARKVSTHRYIWGLLVFLIYNGPLIYYVVIPGVVKQVLCSTDAGFWLYKTPEQWIAENPGVAETLISDGEQENRKIGEGHSERIFHLNQRFDWVLDFSYAAHKVIREEQTVVDIAKDEVMVRRLDFFQQGFKFLGAGSSSGCFSKSERDRWIVNGKAFGQYQGLFQLLGEKE